MKFKDLDNISIKVLFNLLNYNNYEISFYTIGLILSWKDYYHLKYYLHNEETIILKGTYEKDEECYFFPIGKDINSVIKLLCDLPIYYIPESYIFLFKNGEIEEMTNDFDYLYLKSNFLSLSGKRKSKIRNHINVFKKTYSTYKFDMITDENHKDVLKILNRIKPPSFNKNFELSINKYAIKNYKKFHLFGYILYVNSFPIAFTLAEIKNRTLYIHFEKNDKNYRGSGDMNRYLFIDATKNMDYFYINREEDVNDEGLKTSKMRLRPDKFIKKYRYINK